MEKGKPRSWFLPYFACFMACFMPYLYQAKTRWIVMAMKRGSTRGEAIPEKLKQDGAV